MTDEEAAARAVNAEPWEPMPGMVKLRCSTCSYWFAALAADVETCPDCEIRLRRRCSVTLSADNEEDETPCRK